MAFHFSNSTCASILFGYWPFLIRKTPLGKILRGVCLWTPKTKLVIILYIK
jgi:hypothetical protein